MGGRGWSRNQAGGWLGALGLCFLAFTGIEAQAGSLYVYTDAQGQAVLTDNLDQVPAAYRGRVRTMTGTDSPSPPPVPTQAVTGNKPFTSSGVIGDILNAVAAKVGSRTIQGLTAYQTAIVIVERQSSHQDSLQGAAGGGRRLGPLPGHCDRGSLPRGARRTSSAGNQSAREQCVGANAKPDRAELPGTRRTHDPSVGASGTTSSLTCPIRRTSVLESFSRRARAVAAGRMPWSKG